MGVMGETGTGEDTPAIDETSEEMSSISDKNEVGIARDDWVDDETPLEGVSVIVIGHIVWGIITVARTLLG